MKIQIASDLHLEFLQRDFPGETLITPHPDADVLVLAGDIASGTQVIDLFARWPVPVLHVMGNHEAYGRDIQKLEDELRAAAARTQIHFLENDRIDIDGVRFLGTTLWTDYALFAGEGRSIDAAMNAARSFMVDHTEIRLNRQPFAPIDALLRHDAARAWLTAELAVPFDGPTVVVTHHGVHRQSIHPRYAGDLVNASFVSDLSALLAQAALWIHGHVHDSFDYRVGQSRVVVNPRGYALNRHTVNTVRALRFENAAFDPMKLVVVATESFQSPTRSSASSRSSKER